MFRSEAQVWRRDEGPPPGWTKHDSQPPPYPVANGTNGYQTPSSTPSFDQRIGFPGPHNPQPPQTNGYGQYPMADSSAPVAPPAAPPADARQGPAAAAPVRIEFGWKTISTVQVPKRSAVQHFFEEPNAPSSGDHPSKPSSPERKSNGRRTSSPTKPAIDLQQPDIYLDQIAAAEQQYSQHLSTIAPYIQAAFTQWYSQNATPALPDFLVHYFGRPPNGSELAQIQQLLSLKTQLSRDQEELRVLHSQAVDFDPRRKLSNGHWSPPPESRGRRVSWRSSKSKSRSPIKQAINVNAIPLPDRSSFPRVFHETQEEPPLQRPIVANQQKLPPSSDPSPSVVTPSSNHSDPLTISRPSRSQLIDGETYERLACVGEGTYGKVYKARNLETGAFVALKRIRMEGEKDGFPVTAMREIKLLQSLRDENVVRLHEMMVSKGELPFWKQSLYEGSVYMVLEYMDHDLTGLLAHPEVTFSPSNLKSLNHQMLSGLAYLHQRSILHRDMKGSNILLNALGELKLADFGLARVYHKRKRNDYTNRVITLWYRSPELLLGETVYGPEVDMWSAG